MIATSVLRPAENSPGSACGVEQDRQLLDLHDDEIGGVLRDVGIIGE